MTTDQDAASPARPGADGRVDRDEQEALISEGDVAGDYLEQLLDIVDVDGDIDLDVENGRAIAAIVGPGLGHLVGRDGEVLEALQELTRLAVLQVTDRRSRLMLDIDGWRARRRRELDRLGREVAERVLRSGQAEDLPVMTPFERKIVHDAVAEIAGVTSESVGVEPARHIVIQPE